MSSKSIGPKGRLDIHSSEIGPQRMIKVLSFHARADTGYIDVPFLQAGNPPKFVIDVNNGGDYTASFGGTVTGGFSQTDTGVNSLITGHTMFAIVADTGTAGL